MTFAQLLRELRVRAGLTQEELAGAANLSARSISDLERGVNQTARIQTARLLAGALKLSDPVRLRFEAAARGRIPAQWAQEDPRPVGSLAAATRTLPRDIASFVGRTAELGQITDAIAAEPAGVDVYTVAGMAGIGKTALVVHVSHQLAPRFPDGQIFLPLHGHAPGQRPVDPAVALASLLETVGVSAQQLPSDVDARIRLWRDCLAGRRYLIVLDDALGHEQVRPLLPGTAGSCVLITSRRNLTGLEEARAISLDTLHPHEAAEMLTRLAARPDLAAADTSVAEITRLCGYLPLAVRLLARQLHHHRVWTAADLAADLATTRDRLEFLQAENLSVAAAFDLSYTELTTGQQRLFRRLGLHPGPDIDAYAAAALDGTDHAAARRGLAELCDQHLVAEPARGRYRLHDLIGEHARALVSLDPAADRDAAVGRLLDYYLHTALVAGRHLSRQAPASELQAAVAVPPSAPELRSFADAIGWLDAERLNLYAAVGWAASTGRFDQTLAILAAAHGFLRSQGHWDQSLMLHRTVLRAARRAGDRLAEAAVLAGLGEMESLTGGHRAATASLGRALELYRAAADVHGEASALHKLGAVQQRTADYPAATASLTRALDLHRGLGDRLGQALVLNNLGSVQYRTGDHQAAIVSLTLALGLHRGLGSRLGEANALNELGIAQSLAGQHKAAIASLTSALELHRDLGNRLGEANANRDLGVVQRTMGDYQAAVASLTLALQLHRDFGNRFGQASASRDLGLAQRAAGNFAAATASLVNAQDLFQDLGAVAAREQVRGFLDEVTAAGASSG